MSFTVAIVGRPNVGKSTLFNRLVGKRLALVDDRPASPATAAKAARTLGDLSFTAIDTAGLDEAAPESLSRTHAGADRGCDRRRRRGVVRDRRARGIDCRPTAPLPNWCARSGKPVILVANKSEGRADAGRRCTKPMRSASASRSRSRPSTARGSPISTTRCAQRCRRTPRRQTMKPRRGAGQAAAEAPAAPIRIAVVGRPNSGKSTLDQPAARRGAPADRPRGRHHARRDRGRRHLAGIGTSACTTPPACASAPASTRSSRSSRSPTRSTPSASPRW